MQVEELMTKRLHTCSTSDSLNRAAQLMWDEDVGCVPVVDTRDMLVGMLTDRDVAMAAYTQGKHLNAIEVTEVMSRKLYACTVGTEIGSVELAMRTYGFRRLPVIDAHGALKGMITLNDIARAAASMQAPEPSLSPLEVASTLAAVCRHD